MSPNAVYWRTFPLILVGLVLPGFLYPYHDDGVAYGTMAGQTMAAAAWLALFEVALFGLCQSISNLICLRIH